LDALDDWEQHKSRLNCSNLQVAVSTWVDNNNNDFKKRDKLSNGLCKKLAIECGQDALRFKDIPTVAIFGDAARNNHLVGQLHQTIANPNPPPANIFWFRRDPPNRIEVSKKSITAWMSTLNNRGRNLAVILIDTQSVDRGVKVKWDGSKKVLNHMIEVLKKAEELALPVFEFWMSVNAINYNIFNLRTQDAGTILDLRKILHKRNRRNTVYTLRKPSGNIFVGDVFEKERGYVHPDDGLPGKFELPGRPFEQILAGLPNPIDIFVVMGYDANNCVAASMFGGFKPAPNNQFVKGILDRGYNVITSRSLLASTNEPLRADEGWPYMGPCRAV
jgi:hypothetical protein